MDRDENITVELEFEKESNNSIRFREIDSSTGEEIIGTLTIQKDALAELDWDEDENLILTISIYYNRTDTPSSLRYSFTSFISSSLK